MPSHLSAPDRHTTSFDGAVHSRGKCSGGREPHAHHDGLGGSALDGEFVGHLIAVRDLMPTIVFQTAACGKAGCTVEQRRKPPSSSRLSQTTPSSKPLC